MDRSRAKKDLKKLLSILKKEKISFEKLIVFGSFVKGFETEKSDLDICVVSDESFERRELDLAKLSFAAGKANLNVDISGFSVGELKKKTWSTFIHELNTHGIPAEEFLRR